MFRKAFRDYDDAKYNHDFALAINELRVLKEMGY